MRRTLLDSAAVALVVAGAVFWWNASQQSWLRFPVEGWCGTPTPVGYLEHVRGPSHAAARSGDDWNDAATMLLWARTATAFAVGFAAILLPLRYGLPALVFVCESWERAGRAYPRFFLTFHLVLMCGLLVVVACWLVGVGRNP